MPAGGGVLQAPQKGTLAGQPVTMELVTMEQAAIPPWYYYDKVGDPIALL